MKFTVSQVEDILNKNLGRLESLHVQSIHVFGSVASSTAEEGSDIDFLVEFNQSVGMFGFLELKYFLEEIFKVEIDLATEKALHPSLKENILKEAVRVA